MHETVEFPRLLEELELFDLFDLLFDNRGVHFLVHTSEHKTALVTYGWLNERQVLMIEYANHMADTREFVTAAQGVTILNDWLFK